MKPVASGPRKDLCVEEVSKMVERAHTADLPQSSRKDIHRQCKTSLMNKELIINGNRRKLLERGCNKAHQDSRADKDIASISSCRNDLGNASQKTRQDINWTTTIAKCLDQNCQTLSNLNRAQYVKFGPKSSPEGSR